MEQATYAIPEVDECPVLLQTSNCALNDIADLLSNPGRAEEYVSY